MVLGRRQTSPLEQVHVALDLETTGLDSARHAILEVGAVRFRGDEVIDTFQTLVNPAHPIPDFIQRLTNITPAMIERAPFFSTISSELEEFVGNEPVIGHNVQFDVGFLAANGLQLNNPAYDTWDLATVFMPRSRQYSLRFLTAHFNVGHEDAHRALADAMATKEVFLKLLRLAEEQDDGLLNYIANLGIRSRWAVGSAVGGLQGARENGPSAVGLTGLDLEQLAQRLGSAEKRRPAGAPEWLDQERISGLLAADGPFAKVFPGYEYRREQQDMLRAVTGAVYQDHHLVVEGGTGVGKSMAYLLPAALFAASQGRRVVVSTNTINLQEQLMSKDIPALTEVLEESGLLQRGVLKAALLKGRANYLCLRRWNHLASTETPTVEDARLLSKTSVWLQETASGDRSEINLAGRDAASWNHVSAGEKGFCPGLRDGSPCFLRAARERAEQAHVIVVNHALLLADLARGGGLIPDYRHLIVDEAHHLEDEATRQMGFAVSQETLDESWEPHSRLNAHIRLALNAEGMSSAVRQDGEAAASAVEAEGPRLRQTWARLWDEAERFQGSQRGRRGRDQNQGDQNQLLITPELHSTPDWRALNLAWENLDVALQQSGHHLDRLHRFLETTQLPAANDQPALTMEAANLTDGLQELRQRLNSILGEPAANRIHWLDRDHSRANLSFHSVPLDVSGMLAEDLFEKKDSVVLTSATLSAEESFRYFKSRTGVAEEVPELLVGSPFDYRRAAQLLIPEDMPAPSSDRYVDAVARVLTDTGRSLGGRTMALFTSYSALRAVAQRLRTRLMTDGIQVLAQSVDGSAPQLMARFAEEPNSVLLGTASFWEGVDLPSGLLKALVIARLPFQVPTDPVVQARSAQYGDPFNDYSIPQAVLRFRQGIGRLIRNKEDKGTIVLLDQRITGRSYGKAFLRSIPPCTLTPCNAATVGTLAAQWVGGNRGASR